MATLVETQGTVERNDGAQAWAIAGQGVTFVVGDVLRTGAAARARLRLTNGAMIRVSENARIRFARGTLPTGKGADLNVELGSADVEAAGEEVAVVTALGVARVERGARVRVSSDGERSTLEVVVGRAVVLASGGDLVVGEGEGAMMKRGDARPERYRVKLGAAVVEEPAAAPPPSAASAPPAAPAPAAAPEPRPRKTSRRAPRTPVPT